MGRSDNRGCLGFLFGSAAPKPAGGTAQVMLSNRFISEAEASFFRVLRHVVGDRGHILAQVSLGQLLYTKGSGSARGSMRNRYAQKTLDFLICDPQSLRPLLAIELDEPSHARARREDRDELLEQLFDAAGLPYIRVLTSRTYDTRELEAAVAPHLRGGRPAEH